MARLILYTSGTLGDHLPYLALAQGLQARGHEVVMAINRAMHDYAQRAGVPAFVLPGVERGPQEARENAWAWDHWNNPLTGAPHPRAKSQPPEEFVGQVRALGELLDGADLLLATAIRPQGLAAHLLTAVPWLTLSVNPSAFALPTGAEAREQRVFPFERAQYASLRLLLDHTLQELGRPGLPPTWYHGVLWAPHVLLGSSPAFYAPNLDQLQPFSSIDQTGFWLWDDPAWAAWQPPDGLEAFMAERPLLLTFSSQPLEDPAAILRRHVEAAALLGLPLLVQSGWAGFGPADLPSGADPSRVRFLDYAPHDWLFVRAAAAIQHGGIGSLARALRQGCPLLIEPFGNDQFFNAQRTVELGVGASAHPFQSSSAELAELIEARVLATATRLRAKQLGRELEAEDGVAAAVTLVEAALARSGTPQTSRLWWGVRSLGSPLPERTTEGVETAVAAPIPRVLHQTWKTDEIPAEFRAWAASWREHHPNWEFRLWTDADCRALIAEHYPWFLGTYDGYPLAIMRVDAARYFILHRHGGLYADLDYEALRPLDPLLDGRALLLTTEPPAHLARYISHSNRLNILLSNALMASAPGHPFWEHVFDQLAAWRDAPGPLDATGPFLLSRAYGSYAAPGQITVESHLRLSPIEAAEPWAGMPESLRALVAREAYALHHWHGTWHHEPPLTAGPLGADLLLHGRLQPAAARFSRAELAQIALAQPDPPLISCLMVTRERTLLAQLAVNSFRQQSYPACELIILDDGPDNALQDWVAAQNDARIRFLRLPDEARSLGELRNMALAEARGDYVAQWDDDDYAAPERLAVQAGALVAYRVEACLLERQMVWVPQVNFLGKSARRPWEGSALLPRSAVPAYPAQSRGEDTPVVLEAISRLPTVLLDAPELYLYLFHGGNTFDAAHWEEQMRAATTVYTHARYAPALHELQAYLHVELARLGDYLSGRPLDRPRQNTGKTAVAALPPKPPPADPAPNRAAPPPLAGPPATWPSVLILMPVKDAAAHLPLTLANLRALDYPRDHLSLAFLESDSRDDSYAMLAEALPGLQAEFRRAVLLRRDFGLVFDGPRWEKGLQRRRRAAIARSRNTLLQAALADEAWVLWVDADLAEWPADIVQRLLGARRQIVVPNCLRAKGQQPFDLNSYKLQPGADRLDWSAHMVDGLLQPPQGYGRDYLTDLRAHDIVELDGVGGTMLLVDANLHRDGLIFPPFSYRGLIDTEGLAAMAADMGVPCWGLPNLIIRHS